MNEQRIKWIDGLKVIAVIGIILHHFSVEYYPAVYFGSSATSYTQSGIDVTLSELPFFFVLNGDFFMLLTLVLVGVTVTHRVMLLEMCDFGMLHVRRFLRITIPVFAVNTIVWIIDLFGLEFAEGGYGGYTDSYLSVLRAAFIDTPLYGDQTFLGPFWRMGYVFIGGILVSAIAAITWSKKKTVAIIVCAIALIASIVSGEYEYTAVVFGCLFALCTEYLDKIRDNTYVQFFSWILLVMGLFLAAFPTAIYPDNIYMYIDVFNDVAIYHIIGAGMIILAIYNISAMKKILECSFLQWFVPIMYFMFVFHCLFLKIFGRTFDGIFNVLNNYAASVVITLVLVVISTVVISLLYKRLEEVIRKKIYMLSRKNA